MRYATQGPLPYPTLCLVTEVSPGGEEVLLAKVAAAVEGGVDIVQLRAKELPAGRLLDLGLLIKQRINGKAMLFVNDRVDVALALEADGVQLGEEAMPVEAVRRIAGGRLLVGRSVHSVERAIEAEAQGADFLVIGTVFATGSKPELEPTGPELLGDVRKVTNIPFLAIGGVNTTNVAKVLEYGASGVAVISAILASPNAGQAARGLDIDHPNIAVGPQGRIKNCAGHHIVAARFEHQTGADPIVARHEILAPRTHGVAGQGWPAARNQTYWVAAGVTVDTKEGVGLGRHG